MKLARYLALALIVVAHSAAAIDVYLVTRSTQGIVHSFWATEEVCDAVAATDAALTCRGLVDKPDIVTNELWLWNGTQFFRVVNAIAQLRAVAEDAVRNVAALQQVCTAGDGLATADHINTCLDFVYWAVRGSVIVLRRDEYTTARKLEFARSISRGPSVALDFLNDIQAHDLAAPTAPLVWANPGAAGAPNILLSAAVGLSGNDPDNPASLNLADSELSGVNIDSRYNWIAGVP